MAVLIVVALFWGNCFSCPQVLLAAQHGCCHRNKAPKTECTSQGLQNFVKAEKASPDAVAPTVAAIIEPPAEMQWAPEGAPLVLPVRTLAATPPLRI
jgi:hypothetical protein